MLASMMEFSRPPMPPPQGVLNLAWAWRLLVVLLGLLFIMRLIGLDIAGGILAALMMCLASVMLRDGMFKMSRYAFLYGILSSLNFAFELIPLVSSIHGRRSKTVKKTGSSVDENGVKHAIYEVTMHIKPFFDAEQGVVYNIQSIAMILAVAIMLLGCVLSFRCVRIYQQQAYLDDDFLSFGVGQTQAERDDFSPRRRRLGGDRPSAMAAELIGADGPEAVPRPNESLGGGGGRINETHDGLDRLPPSSQSGPDFSESSAPHAGRTGVGRTAPIRRYGGQAYRLV